MKQIKHILSLVGMVVVLAYPLCSQNYSLSLPSGNTTPLIFDSNNFEFPQSIAGDYYLILQFYDLPNNMQKIQMDLLGVQLFDYIPNYAYLARVPVGVNLSSLPIRSAKTLAYSDKMSLSLQQGDYEPCAVKQGKIALEIAAMPTISLLYLRNTLYSELGISGKIDGAKLKLSIEEFKIPLLAQHPGVKAIETIHCTLVPDGIRGRTLGRMNGGNGYSQTAYEGNGVGIAIGDDGGVDHIDFKGRLFDHTQFNTGNHGDMTSGLAIGAGNLNPYGMGMATMSYLHLYDINGMPHVVNAIQSYIDNRVVITSTSFSEGCSAVYNSLSSEIDHQVYTQPQLLHFFSAGNSSGNSCNVVYGQIANPFGIHFGNITGGRKCAKSVIAVGNVRYNDSLFVLSSRGPAIDGRIKPDICAHGQGNLSTDANNKYRPGGGTSAASPTSAGGAALLYEAYRLLHTGLDPKSGLIKAFILNTAEDLGRPGPDFEFGWGRLHIGRAIETLNNGQYLQNTISHNYQKYHQVTIPEGVKEARVMVYWNDPAGSPLSSKALVNDIDMKLVSNAGQQFKPLVLSIVPELDSLIKPAYPGEDHINNVEQVVLKNPQAGTYSVKIFGKIITTASQDYHIVYTFIKDDITITYPNNNEGLVPGQKEVIRWDAYGKVGTFNIEYSADSLQTWNPIANNIPGHQRYLNWWVPYTVTGNAFIRITRNLQSDISDRKFNIIGQPYFDINRVDDNAAQISWLPVEGADAYDIFLLTEKYMEKIGETNQLSFTFPTQIGSDNWISVRAKNQYGTTGRRANAKNYIHRTCNAQFTLNFTFDLYPRETSWTLSQEGQEVLSGGPYIGVPPNSFLSEVKCLPAGCYTLTISDSYGDGICCERGNGHFELYGGSGQLITSGGDFNGNKILFFCIEENSQSFSAGVSGVEHPSCNNSADGSATVFAHGGSGNYTYNWSTGFTGTHPTNLSAGMYSVTISDGVNISTSNITLYAPIPLDIQLSAYPIPCNSNQGGNIASTVTGGTPPYSYQWNDNSQQPYLSNANEGWHSLTVIDSKGCAATKQVLMTRLSSINISLHAVDISCFEASDGGVFTQINGGTPPYSYIWNTGSNTTNLQAIPKGNYSVTVQDNNGCTGIASINIQEPNPLVSNLITQNPSCNGSNNGSIQVFSNGGTGAHQYSWNNGTSFSILNPIGAGAYTVTTTDEKGCTTSSSTVLYDPIIIDLDVMVTHPSAIEGGNIDIEVTGGTPPYQYLWSNNATTQDLYGLSGGQYNLTVTDNNGCQKSMTQVLNTVQVDNYCLSRGSNTQHEWIQSINFNNTENISGPDNGLGNYVGMIFDVIQGQDYPVILTPGFQGFSFNENWRVWIDFNQDFDFNDPGEMVLESSFNNSIITGNITIPFDALTGQTRMRIAMKHGSQAFSCGTFSYGEVEEYTINVNSFSTRASAVINPTLVSFDNSKGKELAVMASSLPFPNPASEKINIHFTSKNESQGTINLYDINYKKVASEVISLKKGNNTVSVPVHHLPAGIYQIEIEYKDGELERQTFVIQHNH